METMARPFEIIDTETLVINDNVYSARFVLQATRKILRTKKFYFYFNILYFSLVYYICMLMLKIKKKICHYNFLLQLKNGIKML